jgi:hypothetical protein
MVTVKLEKCNHNVKDGMLYVHCMVLRNKDSEFCTAERNILHCLFFPVGRTILLALVASLRVLLYITSDYHFMYLRAILCTFQISVDFYYVPVPRMYALFFIDCQSTRELRITSISRDAAI